MSPPVAIVASTSIPFVPFYSQFKDIQAPKWQKVGCGITSLTMIIDYYKPDAVSVNTLLKRGIAVGAYAKNAGWIYAGLIQLSQKYGLEGKYHDLSKLDSKTAFEKFKILLDGGPVILAIHYKFDPKSTVPHLVVINGIHDGVVYYNDPAMAQGAQQISTTDFLKGWKKKVIVIRPKHSTILTLAT
ncbi:MAG: C39 family peptidase [Minisyncoccia bacterium]